MHVWCVLARFSRAQVLASAFSTEIGRLRDAGAAAASGGGGGDGGMLLDGTGEVKGEVSTLFPCSFSGLVLACAYWYAHPVHVRVVQAHGTTSL